MEAGRVERATYRSTEYSTLQREVMRGHRFCLSGGLPLRLGFVSP